MGHPKPLISLMCPSPLRAATNPYKTLTVSAPGMWDNQIARFEADRDGSTHTPQYGSRVAEPVRCPGAAGNQRKNPLDRALVSYQFQSQAGPSRRLRRIPDATPLAATPAPAFHPWGHNWRQNPPMHAIYGDVASGLLPFDRQSTSDQLGPRRANHFAAYSAEHRGAIILSGGSFPLVGAVAGRIPRLKPGHCPRGAPRPPISSLAHPCQASHRGRLAGALCSQSRQVWRKERLQRRQRPEIGAGSVCYFSPDEGEDFGGIFWPLLVKLQGDIFQHRHQSTLGGGQVFLFCIIDQGPQGIED